MIKSLIDTLAGWLLRVLIKSLHLSYRFRFNGKAGRIDPPGCSHYVLAIWHQNLLAGILGQTGRQHVVIVSRSGDGDPVSKLCARLGHKVARGSSRSGGRDKGGTQAKDDMIDLLRSGLPGALTVDGPRGPAHEVKHGIVEMAVKAGVPVVPYLPLPRRYWSFNSWDRFRMPVPFTRIDVHYGEPIVVPKRTPREEFGRYQQQIADALEKLEAELTAAEG